MIGFTLTKTWKSKTVSQPQYQLTWVHTPYVDGKKQYYILPVSQFENDTTLDAASIEKLKQFAADSRTLLNSENILVTEFGQ
ncbi:MAG: hypothetical protein CVU14_12295 [Bacteroidetes bacterium HGW-Bacteroidetes-9]|nr:MAG: hypothetical protein CVU14_12295 [Bacteroidetes bacterium HGW-Bacteroidetes-9]